MYECEGRVTDRVDDHNYPSPADLRRLMGAVMPENDFLVYQELFRNKVRETIRMATNTMAETQVMVRDLMSKVEEVKIQLSQMSDTRSSAPLVPRADPNEGVCAVVRPSRSARKPRTPRGSRSNSARMTSRPLTPVNPAGGITTSVGQISTSHPDIFELFQTSQANTSAGVPVEAAIPVDPFKSDDED